MQLLYILLNIVENHQHIIKDECKMILLATNQCDKVWPLSRVVIIEVWQLIK